MNDCIFCRIIGGKEPVEHNVYSDICTIAFVPLDPVADGHLLVVPRRHVVDAIEVPTITARTMLIAAQLAATRAPCNIITSVGAEATQTVFHLHIHIVPRRAGDGLQLPWGPPA